MDNRDRLWILCQEYITSHKISCPEAVCQSDNVILDAYDFIEEICNIIGYYNYDDE